MNPITEGMKDRMRREAKRMKRAGTHTHMQALDEQARGLGFKNWHDLETRNRTPAIQIATGDKGQEMETDFTGWKTYPERMLYYADGKHVATVAPAGDEYGWAMEFGNQYAKGSKPTVQAATHEAVQAYKAAKRNG